LRAVQKRDGTLGAWETAMRTILSILCLCAVGVMTAGCVDVDADASDIHVGDWVDGSPPPPPSAASDPRTVGELEHENAQLRQTLTDLEADHAALKREVSDLEREKDRLEDRLDDLEDIHEDLEDDYEDYMDDRYDD